MAVLAPMLYMINRGAHINRLTINWNLLYGYRLAINNLRLWITAYIDFSIETRLTNLN